MTRYFRWFRNLCWQAKIGYGMIVIGAGMLGDAIVKTTLPTAESEHLAELGIIFMILGLFAVLVWK